MQFSTTIRARLTLHKKNNARLSKNKIRLLSMEGRITKKITNKVLLSRRLGDVSRLDSSIKFVLPHYLYVHALFESQK